MVLCILLGLNRPRKTKNQHRRDLNVQPYWGGGIAFLFLFLRVLNLYLCLAMNRSFLLTCCLMLAFCSGAIFAEGTDANLKGRIEYVLGAVAKSDMTFIRNGEPHTGKEAADHMRAKYEHYQKDIKSVEDFIRLAGTKSLVSGKPYLVKTKEGKEQRSDEWLRSLAASYKGP